MNKTSNTKGVPRPGDTIHIPLKTDEALRALLKVKPTADMPRPGATNKSPKRAAKKTTAQKQTGKGV